MDWTDYPLTLNATEIGEILRVSTNTVLEMLRSGRLPGQKAGREWRVSRELLRAWLEQVDHDQAIRIYAWRLGKRPEDLTESEVNAATLHYVIPPP